jgi:sugar lactone lactonase YvrE
LAFTEDPKKTLGHEPVGGMMSKTNTLIIVLVVGAALGIAVDRQLLTSPPAVNAPPQAEADSVPPAVASASYSAVPGEIGAQDIFGPYEVVEGWPQDLATLPGHQEWTYGSARGIFAESPDRVFLLGGGELPALDRPSTRLMSEIGPSVLFPVGGLPWRNANNATPPGGGGSGSDPAQGMELWRTGVEPNRGLGVDARWEHAIVVVNAEGEIIEEWTQWDDMFKRPHAIYISPYDPEKHVWVVDDHTHAIYKFTNDGEELVQTLGTPNVPGADATHFNRPTFMAWAADGSFYVADGYNGTRVAKFDAEGNFLFDFGMAGESGSETRPGYMNNVHGVAVDIETGRVFVNDRDNHRIQIFDENGNYLSEWSIDMRPSSLHFVQIGDDGALVTFDRNTHKLLKYDLEGNLLYSWGTVGTFPGTLWGVHGLATDQEGNLYVAEVDSGRFQKFRPRQGANPEFLIGKPVYSAWE